MPRKFNFFFPELTVLLAEKPLPHAWTHRVLTPSSTPRGDAWRVGAHSLRRLQAVSDFHGLKLRPTGRSLCTVLLGIGDSGIILQLDGSPLQKVPAPSAKLGLERGQA